VFVFAVVEFWLSYIKAWGSIWCPNTFLHYTGGGGIDDNLLPAESLSPNALDLNILKHKTSLRRGKIPSELGFWLSNKPVRTCQPAAQ
jgi:hypothetical protein